MSDQIVVVGGSVATTAFIERLRELGSTTRVVVVDADPDAPYDRPPLSKRYLVEGDVGDIAVDWSDLDVTLVRGLAIGVDRAGRELHVRTESGSSHGIPYGRLVIATGAVPARLPIEPPDTAVLRSAADARHLRQVAQEGTTAIIIGAGAIGVELASSLSVRGVRVVLLDRAGGPLERLLSGHLAGQITEWLTESGVDCRWHADIARIGRHGDRWRVELGDSEVLEGELLVSAVGARPAVAWLSESGLLTDGALIVDYGGRVLGPDGPIPDVSAMGDVVSRRAADGSLHRSESWASARRDGAVLAEDLCGVVRQPEPLPYFWTEVAGRNIQVVGTLNPGFAPQLEFENPERRAALYRVGSDGESAWIGVNAQPQIAKLLMGV